MTSLFDICFSHQRSSILNECERMIMSNSKVTLIIAKKYERIQIVPYQAEQKLKYFCAKSFILNFTELQLNSETIDHM